MAGIEQGEGEQLTPKGAIMDSLRGHCEDAGF